LSENIVLKLKLMEGLSSDEF